MSTSSLKEIRNDLNSLKFDYDSMSPTIGDEITYIVDKLEEIIAELPQNEYLPCPWCGEEADVVELTTYCDETTFYKISCNDHTCLGANIHMWYDSKEKAISAWNTRSYLNPDGLPVGLTISDDAKLLDWRGENYIKQNSMYGTLTADDIRDLIERHSDELSGNGRYFYNGAYTAIADELNTDLNIATHDWHEVRVGGNLEGYECECGHMLPEIPKFCPNCGVKSSEKLLKKKGWSEKTARKMEGLVGDIQEQLYQIVTN